MKPQQRTRLDLIKADLLKGMERGAIIEKYSKKFGIGERAIDRLLITAKKEATQAQKSKEKVISEVRDKEIAEAAKNGVLSELELDLFLSAVVKGEESLDNLPFVTRDKNSVKQAPVKPNLLAKIKATELLYKRKGSLIDKTDITSGGVSIKNIILESVGKGKG